MWSTLFFVFALLHISVSAKNHNEINKLAKMILESKTFPGVNNHTAAKELAYLLEAEFKNYEQAVLRSTSQPPLQAFDCPIAPRSVPRPTNAQRLRPADIDVVATIGDSVAAGFGALSGSIFTIFTEYRGYSFPVGGEQSYEQFITVPNILKKFNPELKGFAIGNGGQTSGNAKLNSAVSGARSYDLLGQLSYLHTRMSSEANMAEDWKLLSIFVGGNDLCDFCSDTTKNSPTNFRNNIEAALDDIKARFPRVFVNLISPPDVTILGEVSEGLCSLLHSYECGCATDAATHIAHAKYIEAVTELITLPKYSDKEDFHVSFQPFLSKFTLPRDGNGVPDRSYFAPDCFHFSGKAHQAAAIALWNNMVEATDKKDFWVPGEAVECTADYLY